MSFVAVSHDETLRRDDIRAQIRAFSLSQAEGPDREIIRALCLAFEEHNDRFFDGKLAPAPILITPPSSARAFADAGEFGSSGWRLEMRVRPACAQGVYPTGKFSPGKGYWRMRPGHALASRLQWLSDVVLHEMVHLWLNQIEAPGRHEHQGHGAPFTAECNRIGAMLSSQWPFCVRPGGEYGPFYGDLWERVPGEGDEPELSQLEKLLATFAAFTKVWTDPVTTDTDRARFWQIVKTAKEQPEATAIVMISHDMESA